MNLNKEKFADSAIRTIWIQLIVFSSCRSTVCCLPPIQFNKSRITPPIQSPGHALAPPPTQCPRVVLVWNVCCCQPPVCSQSAFKRDCDSLDQHGPDIFYLVVAKRNKKQTPSKERQLWSQSRTNKQKNLLGRAEQKTLDFRSSSCWEDKAAIRISSK